MIASASLSPAGFPAVRAEPAWRPAMRVGLASPGGHVALLILAGLLARLLLSWMLGLGIDESYMVAAGRQLQLSYFDHPPMAWWISRGAALAAGSEARLVVRLPFILLFALSTWLMYRLARELFSAEAGIWSALALNLAPVFGVTTASWVLPDGPLDCALLGFALCLVRALPARGAAAWRFWIGAGACAGLALLSKYSAVLVLAGAGLYLLTQPAHRRWLARPQPWAGAALALLLFAPVIVWNWRHGWASFGFQGARAEPGGLHPLGPLVTLAGEALYLLPWIWLPMIAALIGALRRGPGDAASWLLACLGIIPVVLFAAVSLWSRKQVQFHWAAPGYLMLFPLLGAAIAARIARGDRLPRAAVVLTVLLTGLIVSVAGTEVRFNWIPGWIDALSRGHDPDLAAVDWTPLRKQLAARGLLERPGTVIAATRWLDAGKLDYALGGRAEVICLGDDPREYGIVHPAMRHAGEDVLIVAPGEGPDRFRQRFGADFRAIEVLPPLQLTHAGRPAMQVPLYLGHGLQDISRQQAALSGYGTIRSSSRSRHTY